MCVCIGRDKRQCVCVYQARDKGISAHGVICVPLKFIMCSDSEVGEAKLRHSKRSQTTQSITYLLQVHKGVNASLIQKTCDIHMHAAWPH